MYSDGHSLLSFEIKVHKINIQDKTGKQKIEYPAWENTKVQSFLDKINLLKLQNITEQFSLESENGTYRQKEIDKIVNEISNLFAESATQSFVSRPKFHKPGRRSGRASAPSDRLLCVLP